MASKKYYIGVLVMVILLASIYIMLPNKVRIDVDNYKTTYKLYEDGYFVTTAVEYTRLINGTKLLTPLTRNVSFVIYENKTTIIRRSYLNENITVINSYQFDGNIKNIEYVPISHSICFTNAKEKTFEYLVTDSKKIYNTSFNIKSPFKFGKMKLTFEGGYSTAKYSTTHKISIKYNISNNSQCFGLRLFDPEEYIPKSSVNGTASLEQGASVIARTVDGTYATDGTSKWSVDSGGVSSDKQQMGIWNFSQGYNTSRFDMWFGRNEPSLVVGRIQNGSIYYTTLDNPLDYENNWLLVHVTENASTGFKSLDISGITVTNATQIGTCSVSVGKPHQFYDCNPEILDNVFVNLTFSPTNMTAFRLNISKGENDGNFELGEVDFFTGNPPLPPLPSTNETFNVSVNSCYNISLGLGVCFIPNWSIPYKQLNWSDNRTMKGNFTWNFTQKGITPVNGWLFNFTNQNGTINITVQIRLNQTNQTWGLFYGTKNLTNTSFVSFINITANTTKLVNLTLDLYNLSQSYVNWTLVNKTSYWTFNYTIDYVILE